MCGGSRSRSYSRAPAPAPAPSRPSGGGGGRGNSSRKDSLGRKTGETRSAPELPKVLIEEIPALSLIEILDSIIEGRAAPTAPTVSTTEERPSAPIVASTASSARTGAPGTAVTEEETRATPPERSGTEVEERTGAPERRGTEEEGRTGAPQVSRIERGVPGTGVRRPGGGPAAGGITPAGPSPFKGGVDVRSDLRRLGFDGRDSTAWFQASHGVRATGLVDEPTQRALVAARRAVPTTSELRRIAPEVPRTTVASWRPALGASMVAERVDTPRLLDEVRARTADRQPVGASDVDAREQDRALRSAGGQAGRPAGRRTTGRKNAVWSTGRRGGRGGVTSTPLQGDGAWSAGDFLSHHADRSRSWAANNIRNAANQDLQAYDFTFERADASGRGVAGSARGLELVTPFDARVIDIQHTFQGSGGYGKFIALEDVETGRRISVHHLDSVRDLRKGQIIKGGTVFGTQGGSGNTRSQYAPHVDIVGTTAAVSDFVRANQTGEFRTHDP